MTERLYYENAYLTEFDAVVEEVCPRDEKQLVRLNRSAFYPTSGGQPYDTGALNGVPVTDVFVDKSGEVWHEIDGSLVAGETVHGKIDWERRWDHMQQHGGEHMIAGAIYNLTGGMTIGLHLGAEVSSIDVEFADGATHMSDELIAQVEDYVNARIQRDMCVKCWFPDAQELTSLPLRKAPTVKEHVRIVAMGDFEMVACGGTHPSSTGQIGLVKIVSVAPAKGKARVSFVCGRRAYADYRANYNSAWAAANLLSTRPENLPAYVQNLLDRLKSAEHDLSALRRQQLFASMPERIAGAQALSGGGRLVCAEIEADAQLLKDFASKLIEQPGVAALLAAKAGEKYNFVFARSADLNYPMGAVLSAAAKPLGGKGGGRSDFAQGGGPLEVLWAAREQMLKGN